MSEKLQLGTVLTKQDSLNVKEKCPYVNDKSDNLPRYKALRKWFYYLLERPNTRFAVVYHFISLSMILGSLIVSVLSTIQELETRLEKVMFYYELFLLIWFSGEFAFRMWSCSYVSRYQGNRGRLRFLLSVYMLIDIFVILSTITTFAIQVNGSYFSILRVTRFMQVFRILRIDRQRGDFRTMGNVVKEHSKELITVYFVGFVIMFSATYIVYLCEKHTEMLDSLSKAANSNNESSVTIDNMANGLYWAVITVTSVGYGDFSPVTWAGKIFCAIFALIGCAFFSLPAGILGSGFALQVAKQKKEKRYVKVRNPAAYLIQTMWRNYAIRKEEGRFEASWFYLLPQLREGNNNSNAIEMMMRTEINKGVMFTPMFSIISPKKEFTLSKPTLSPNLSVPRTADSPSKNMNNNPLEEGIKKLGKIISRRTSDTNSTGSTQILKRESLMKPKYRYEKKPSRSDTKKAFKMADSNGINYNGVVDQEKVHKKIHKRYKIALRFIMKLRYWTAIKIFKTVRHPFVNMQDIMEKNAISHVEMLCQIKSMRDSFNVLHEELLELRYTLIDLKKQQELSTLKTQATKLASNKPAVSKSLPNSPRGYRK